MIELYLHAVGLAAPGLPDWPQAHAVLRGQAPYQAEALAPYAPPLLPPNERRRATPVVRQAFRVAEQAIAGRDASDLATVFSGSDADMAILHRISAALATPERIVSPTDFHNSVHNAAAGYWGIGTGSRAPSTTLAGYDASFALGLLEAGLQVISDRRAVLLVVFDVPAPEPLLHARAMAVPASCALWLSHEAMGAIARLQLAPCADDETPMRDAALELVRLGNPALRSLPLLQMLARGERGRVVLPNAGGRKLAVDVLP